MQNFYKEFILKIGEDPNREGLRDTPERAVKALMELTRGYNEDLDSIVNGALFENTAQDEMVIVKDIEIYSLCEHHFLPFLGTCHVGYLAKDKVLGLSKVARIVDCFSKRLQIQERLTTEIAEYIEKITGATGVGVIIEAKHLCMMMRGVEKQKATMTTSAMLGEFRNNLNTRMEFMQLIK